MHSTRGQKMRPYKKVEITEKELTSFAQMMINDYKHEPAEKIISYPQLIRQQIIQTLAVYSLHYTLAFNGDVGELKGFEEASADEKDDMLEIRSLMSTLSVPLDSWCLPPEFHEAPAPISVCNFLQLQFECMRQPWEYLDKKNMLEDTFKLFQKLHYRSKVKPCSFYKQLMGRIHYLTEGYTEKLIACEFRVQKNFCPVSLPRWNLGEEETVDLQVASISSLFYYPKKRTGSITDSGLALTPPKISPVAEDVGSDYDSLTPLI